jgi:hypothetical protein
VLLAAVYDPRTPAAEGGLTRPIQVGLAAEWAPAVSGELYLRINDPPGELADNQGKLTVAIDPLAEAPREGS